MFLLIIVVVKTLLLLDDSLRVLIFACSDIWCALGMGLCRVGQYIPSHSNWGV